MDFVGHWRIERKIQDGLAGQNAVFIGTASISITDEDWVYAETGTLKLSGTRPMTAERRYIWRPDATGIDIFFSDNRFFHRLELAQPQQSKHWCDPDQYNVTYDLTHWPNWQATWRVVGPRKDYVMKSEYFPSD
jgi:hypothetical protein